MGESFEMSEDTKSSKTRRWTTPVLIASVVLATVVVAALCTTLTFYLHPDYGTSGADDGSDFEPLPTEPDVRVDCVPDRDQSATEELCMARGCLWRDPYREGQPWCFFPDDYSTYHFVTEEAFDWGTRLRVNRNPDLPSFFNNDIETLAIDIEHQTDSRLHMKIYDPSNARYEVPLDMPSRPDTMAVNPHYAVEYTNKPFTIKVTRRATGQVLFDTSIGALIFEDQFLSISTRLPSTNVYGLGENEHHSFRHDLDWRTWGAFSRDQPPGGDANLYGVHPFYMCVENDANAHGVFLLNSNAQDFALQPTPALTYHTIGGVLDFYMFMGPTPENVVMQYTEAIGRTMMPPYWALGYQLSRYGYNSLDNVKGVVDSMRQYDIPHDVQYGDIDYMERQLDFTIDVDDYVGLGDWVDSIKQQGTRYIIILDPAIGANETSYPPYDLGVQHDVFIKNGNGEILMGKVWPDYEGVTDIDTSLPWEEQVRLYRSPAAFPDFRKAETKQWWRDEIVKFHDEIAFDGLWIDMNEPASFVHGSIDGCPTDGNTYDYPPFLPRIWGPNIFEKTICMNSVQHVTESTKGLHYDMHSLYGWSQSEPTKSAAEGLLNRRSLVITRSTFPSSGKYAGHWLGDNTSIWPHLTYSIIGMLEFNLFGIPYIGADICGFFNDADPEMCLRWHQVGAFYPYSRNHNGLGNAPQHPAAFGQDFANSVRDVLHTRYRLLPYLYTLFYHAHTTGSTVVRPLMHEFTSDSNTWDIYKQFMWGPALMISPVLEPDTTSVRVYIPVARWYDYYTGMEVPSSLMAIGGGVELAAPLDYINLHVRGGYIIPTQEPHNSTMFSRMNDFGLMVALDSSMEAAGDLFWDDGDSLDTIMNEEYYMFKYTFANNILTAEIVNEQLPVMDNLMLDHVKIYGLSEVPSRVVLTEYSTLSTRDVAFDFNQGNKTLMISPLAQAMNMSFSLNVIM